jgi:EAL domain-containing protein (putative c-di-GMP-specific phosphodiesterase class I)
MSEVRFLKTLEKRFQAFSDSSAQDAGGLICVQLDHVRDLRERHGYSGLLDLRNQATELVVNRLGKKPPLFHPDAASVVLMLSKLSPQALETEARESFKQLEQHEFSLEDEVMALTVSLSFCPFDPRFSNGDQALVAALARLESIAAQGGNEVAMVTASHSVSQADGKQKQMLNLLMEALRTDSIRVVYQPFLSTGNDSVRGFQMLPRLKANDGSLITAAEFLPAARAANLLGTLDRWMLSHAVDVLEEHGSGRAIRLFISQSGELLADEKRRERLIKQLDSGTDIRGKLVLDFRLSDATSHLKGTEALIEEANRLGVEVCISQVDDHSNWDLLAGRLRANYLRMAPAYVARLVDSDDLEKDIDRFTSPLRKLGTRIILPMIEDPEAAAILWRCAVDYLQGNLIQQAEESLRLTD